MSTQTKEAIAREAAEQFYREFKEYAHGRNTVEHHYEIILIIILIQTYLNKI
jgi:hypothetical protein